MLPRLPALLDLSDLLDLSVLLNLLALLVLLVLPALLNLLNLLALLAQQVRLNLSVLSGQLHHHHHLRQPVLLHQLGQSVLSGLPALLDRPPCYLRLLVRLVRLVLASRQSRNRGHRPT